MFIDPKLTERQASRSADASRKQDSERNTDEHPDPTLDASTPATDGTAGVDGEPADSEPADSDSDCRVASEEPDEPREEASASMVEAERFRRDLSRRILAGMWPRASCVDNPANFAPSSEINFTANDYVMQCDPVDDSDPEADKSDYLDYLAFLKELDEVDELDVEEGGLDDAHDVPANDDLVVRPRQEATDKVLSPGYQVSRTVHPEGD